MNNKEMFYIHKINNEFLILKLKLINKVTDEETGKEFYKANILDRIYPNIILYPYDFGDFEISNIFDMKEAIKIIFTKIENDKSNYHRMKFYRSFI